MAVYARKNSPYWWVYLEGERRRISTKIKKQGATPTQTRENRALAEAAYQALMGDIARDRFDLPSVRKPRTFDQQAAWYLEHHTPRHLSADTERPKIARLRAFFGRYPLADVTPNRWQEYTTARTQNDGVSLSTVGRELAIAKAILSTAVGEHIAYNPLATVKRKKVRLPAKRTITAVEETRLLEQLSDAVGDRGDRSAEQAEIEQQARREMRDMYLVGVGTLLRQVNIVELQRLHHRGDRLALDTKTGPHQIPLTGPTPLQRRAAAVLKRRLPKTQVGYFFPVWQGRFARDRNGANAKFLQAFRRACKRAGIPWGLENGGVVWHTATRATGATRMLREYRIDVRTVQMIGGWASLDQMADYLGVALDLFGAHGVHTPAAKLTNRA